MTIERLSITFTSNGKREFEPRDQVFPYPLFIISTHKLVVSRIFYVQKNFLRCFYLLIFYFEKFSTWIWRFPFGAYVTSEAQTL